MTSTWRDYTRHKPNGAYVGGDWGIPYDQTALVGELQPELLVRNGKWQLIGANGAEFVGLRKGDIILIISKRNSYLRMVMSLDADNQLALHHMFKALLMLIHLDHGT